MTSPEPTGPAPSIRDALSDALTAAMKRRDSGAVAALRSALGAIANAEAIDPAEAGVAAAGAAEQAPAGVGAADAPRRRLTQEQERTLVQGEIAALDSAAAEYHCFGSHDQGERLLAQAAVLRSVLRGDPWPTA